MDSNSFQKAWALQQLVSHAEAQGSLTIEDIFELLPELQDCPDVLEVLLEGLEEEGIQVLGGREMPPAEVDEVTVPDLTTIPTDDTISLYFGEIRWIPLLTPEQEVELAKQIEAGEEAAKKLRCLQNQKPDTGDTAQQKGLSEAEREKLWQIWQAGQQARHTLVQSNSRLVISIAKRYIGQGVPFLDLIQEGNLGLMKAAEKFDYRMGNRFSTYATWWIRQSITRALADQGRTIRVPVHMNDRIRRVYGVAQALEQELERKPTPEEIAREMGLTPRQVQQALRASRRPISLEKPVGEDGDSELGQFVEDDQAPDPVEEAARFMLVAEVDELLHALTPREERILRMRYGLGGTKRHTLKQVGKKFGLTRERIRQIEQEALQKLRNPRRSQKLRSYIS